MLQRQINIQICQAKAKITALILLPATDWVFPGNMLKEFHRIQGSVQFEISIRYVCCKKVNSPIILFLLGDAKGLHKI